MNCKLLQSTEKITTLVIKMILTVSMCVSVVLNNMATAVKAERLARCLCHLAVCMDLASLARVLLSQLTTLASFGLGLEGIGLLVAAWSLGNHALGL